MGFLTDDELDALIPAEMLPHTTPIPTQIVSSDEYIPAPQSEKQKQVEARLLDMGDELGKPQGLDRREFFQTAAGMAAAFVAMNDTFGPLFDVEPGRGRDAGHGAGARRRRSRTSSSWTCTRISCATTRASRLRARARGGGQGRLEPGARRQAADHRGPEVRQLLQGDLPRQRHQGRADLERAVRRSAGLVPHQRDGDCGARTRQQGSRLQAHVCARHLHARAAGLARGAGARARHEARLHQGLHDRRQHQQARQQVSLAHGRREGHLPGLRAVREARHQERLRAQGPVPRLGREAVPAPARLLRRARRRQGGEGLAAAQFRHLSLGLSPFRRRQRGQRLDRVRADRPRRLGERPGGHPAEVRRHQRLWRRGPAVRAERGGRAAARRGADGHPGQGLGADHVCWGTDAIWTGSPQWQIEALRRLEIPEDMQKKYGFQPLGGATARSRPRSSAATTCGSTACRSAPTAATGSPA